MSWPLSQDYNEAIQSPASNFSDADLKRGEAVCNGLGLPMPYSGNFADVYQVRCPDGSRWAVKCFTREAVGLRERYQEISVHLGKASLPFTVDFTYLEKGIRVAGKWHPILKMQWVEGLTLNQFVSKYIDKPAKLESLCQIWTRMATRLRAADVAHGDLQHGNILLVPGVGANSLALKLIDYDGMWTPWLAKVKSGEVGHGNYQHPQRSREGIYNAEVDRFPLLLIATALRALTIKGKELWDKYDNGDNLLFKEADLLAPLKSLLFLDLTKVADPAVKLLVDCLVKALRQGLDFAPLLQEVLREPTASALPQEPRQPTPAPIARIISPVPSNLATPSEAWYSDASSRAALAASPRSEGKPMPTKGVSIGAWIASVVALMAIGGAAGSYLVMKSGGFDKKEIVPPRRVSNPNKGREAFIADLADSSAPVRQNAALALGRLGEEAGPDAVTGLARLLRDEDEAVRRDAALSLARIGPASQKAMPELIQALKYIDSPYNSNRRYVAEALGEIRFPGLEDAIPALLNIIKDDPDEEVRFRAVAALFTVPDLDKYEITPVLTEILDETGTDSIMTRYQAALLMASNLGDKAPDKTVDMLVAMLKNRGAFLFNGNEATATGDGTEGTIRKSKVLINQDDDVRSMAAEALRWLGRKANRPDVLKALQEAAQDNDRKLSLEAKAALLAIKRTTAP